MTDRKKVGWDNYLQEVKNQAPKGEISQNQVPECEKSGK